MYSQGSYGTASSTITNNPFVSDPTNASSRFPDISGIGGNNTGGYPNSNNAGSWNQLQSPGGGTGGGYPGSTFQPQQQTYSGQYPPQMGGGLNPATIQQYSSGYNQQSSGLPFQPSSSFGQQLVGQVNGSLGSYGYLQQHPVAGTPTGYPLTGQQQVQNNPGYIAQFDPYSGIGQGWGDISSQQNQLPALPQNNTHNNANSTHSQPVGGVLGPKGDPHPRDCIRSRKAELETWDQYAWKQLLNAFDALKDAWGARKNELQGKISGLQQQLQYSGGGYYASQIQQEGMRLQGLLKDANSHVDSISASIFQMREVFSSYRQSGDVASKRRVRESCNAALTNLPDWPAQY